MKKVRVKRKNSTSHVKVEETKISNIILNITEWVNVFKCERLGENKLANYILKNSSKTS